MNRKANTYHSLDWFSSILPLGEGQKHCPLLHTLPTQSWDVTASPAHVSLSGMLSSFTACPCSHHTLPQTMRFHDYFSPLRAFTAPRSSLHTGRWELKVSLVLPTTHIQVLTISLADIYGQAHFPAHLVGRPCAQWTGVAQVTPEPQHNC